MAENKGGGIFDGLFLGALVGGALAVLFTPFTGSEARQKLKEKIGDVKKTGGEAVSGVRDNSDEAIANSIKSIEDGISRLTGAVEQAQKAADDKRKELEGA